MRQRTHLTLEAVEQQFTAWRAIKKSGEKIPTHLWELVKQLIGSYKISQIITRLHLSTKQMQKEGLYKSSNHQTKSPSSAPGLLRNSGGKDGAFVKVDLPKLSSIATQPNLTAPQLIIERADGLKLLLSQLSEQKLNALVDNFLEK